MKKIALFLCMLLVAIPLAACAPTESTPPSAEPTATTAPDASPSTEPEASAEPEAVDFTTQLIEADKLIIGISPDYPPYEYLDEAGNIVGFDVDMVNYLAQKMGLTVEFSPMEFGTIIAALQSGQVDVGVAAFTYEADRDVIFSTPYLESAQVCVVPAASEFQTISDLAGKKVGAGLGTTGEGAAKEQIADVDLYSADDYGLAFEMLKNGQLDAVVCDQAVARNYATQADVYRVLEQPIISEENSIIIHKNNAALADAINAAIAEFVASEEYIAFQDTHMGN